MEQLQKLHRSTKQRMIVGVMGGIAEYLGWDPNMLRIVFVLVSAFSAAIPGILIYVTLWVLMPEATESSYVNNNIADNQQHSSDRGIK